MALKTLDPDHCLRRREMGPWFSTSPEQKDCGLRCWATLPPSLPSDGDVQPLKQACSAPLSAPVRRCFFLRLLAQRMGLPRSPEDSSEL